MDGHSKEIRSGKTKEILYRAVIFLGEFSHCDQIVFEEIGKIRCNSKKNAQKMEKIDKVYKSQN
jgi:hypothetical protein